MPTEIPLDISIFCQHPPSSKYEGKPALFGLQDKTGALLEGRWLPDGALAFDVQITLSDDDPPKIGGKHAHGKPNERFLYLSYRYADKQNEWIKRIKIPLNTITAAQVKALKTGEARTLATTIDGRKAATVATEWKLVKRLPF